MSRRSRALLLDGACWAGLSLLVGLLALALVPVALGWRSDVVLSGSMRPAVEPGDVVVSAPVGPGQVRAGRVRAGQVVVVDDPVRPGGSLVHRVAEVRPDGRLVTRGDANEHPDSTPVEPTAVHGRAVVRVPAAGLPALWLHQGAYGPLLLGTAALVLVARRAVRARADRTRRQAPPRRGGSRRPRAHRGGRRAARALPAHPATAGALAVVLLGAAVVAPGEARAAFVATTSSSGNRVATKAAFPSYPQTVLADGPLLHHRLDDAPGTSTAAAAAGPAGSYTGPTDAVVTSDDAITGDAAGTAVLFAGDRYAATDTPVDYAPRTGFTLEAWVRTSTGGSLLRLTDSRTETTGGAAQMWVDPKGQACVLVRQTDAGGATVHQEQCGADAGDPKIFTPGSTAAPAWHHVVATVRQDAPPKPNGSEQDLVVYVDGTEVFDAGLIGTLPAPAAGHWRLGTAPVEHENLAFGEVAEQFTGALDEVAVYARVLAPEEVVEHSQARTRTAAAYRGLVASDAPQLHWRLDDPAPLRVVADAQGAEPGTYGRFPRFALGVRGALEGTAIGNQASSTAVRLRNGSGTVETATITSPLLARSDPVTLEVWFRADGADGGPLVGFSAAATGTSTSRGPTLYVTGAGAVAFTAGDGRTPVQSPTGRDWSDGQWHLATATSSSAGGARLYLDGVQVASGADTAAAGPAQGHWRWAGGDAYAFTPAPAASAFTGSLDEAAVYARVLTAEQVAVRFAADH
ncbi:LamG-like jellyroll fold domain-containing protein [Quadrisphaera sp. DSM 44207]|uniref:LamG-like jellyroll fold domain-containing protein n=1 Tax=Quadrisphaera sp. DSM 44207 TaxID=1881057 RepID=UPI000883D1AD|nr:LamG-like jellyroll fold domain-containing protein [Quadrisphaera sp. DSM 44207]SDQ11713.1 signal peptidase I [Quadrisphaera sp. DSM 44207]